MNINNKHKSEVEERGYTYLFTYDRNDITLDKQMLLKRSSQYVRVTCPYCKISYDIQLTSFKNSKANCLHCCNKYENSFAYYIEKELNEPLDKYWDFEKNILNPYFIYKSSALKVWIKCTKTDYHKSYEMMCKSFTNGRRCPYCVNQKVHPRDSFAQYHINNTDKDFLEKYWSDKNKLNPWEISPNADRYIWIKCNEKYYHDDYKIKCRSFSTGGRCPYCKGIKTHPKDSFGCLYPKKVKNWSPNNEKSPFEVTPFSNKVYKLICSYCGEEFERDLAHTNRSNIPVKCSNCVSSKGENQIKEWLETQGFILNNDYILQKTFDYLLGVGNGNLSYDFYLPEYNLLIEYQGEFHDGTAMYDENSFNIQCEHDRRKKEYAINNGINLLEIWYWDFDNIEKILEKTITIINKH